MHYILILIYLISLIEATSLHSQLHKQLLIQCSVTLNLIDSQSCNLEALLICSYKYFNFTNDSQILYELGQFYLFGFPQNQGNEYLSFCQQYGDYQIQLNDYDFSRNTTKAYNYFDQAKSHFPNSYVYMAFIDLLNLTIDNQPIKQLKELYMVDSQNALQVSFILNYQCMQYNQTKMDILKEIYSDHSYLNFLENLHQECATCDHVFDFGYNSAIQIFDDYLNSVDPLNIDYEEYTLVEQMAQNNDEEAILQQAYQYFTGNDQLGIKQDISKAKNLFQKLNENPYALYNLGVIEFQQENYQQALYYFQEAAKYQLPNAYEGLGQLYYNGLGVAQDLEKGKLYIKIAAQLGSEKAQMQLALFEFDEGNDEAKQLILDNIENYNELKFYFIEDYHNYKNESYISCEYATNLLKSLIFSIKNPQFEKEYEQIKIYSTENANIYQEYHALLGHTNPSRVEERFLYGIQGAGMELGDKLIDPHLKQIKKQLYQIDSINLAEAQFKLSQMAYDEDDMDEALIQINELIKRCHQGTFSKENLLPAYIWKLVIQLIMYAGYIYQLI